MQSIEELPDGQDYNDSVLYVFLIKTAGDKT
jgi:hypothetical protein